MRGALFLALLGLSYPCLATVIIPSYNRNYRSANVGPAIGWSDTHEAGLIYTKLESEKKTNGVKADDTDLTLITPYVFHRVSKNVNMEVQYQKLEAETKAPGTPKDTADAQTFQAGFGYEMTSLPMEIGFQLYNFQYKEKDGSTGIRTVDSDSNIYGLHAGYRMPSDLYLGIAWYHTAIETNSADGTGEQLYAGMGQVFGERANPEAAYEVYLSYGNSDSSQDWELTFDGILNRGPLEYRGIAAIGKTDGATKGSDYQIQLTLDYLLPGGVFLGPQATHSGADAETGTKKTKDSSLDLSLQAGYRSQTFEGAVTYTVSSSETKQTAPTVSKDETEGSTVAVHGSYFF
jgi:hypothetical protein